MYNWFEGKIRYEKVNEADTDVEVTESYLVDALSFIEVETRLIEELTPFISGEFTVSGIKRVNYREPFFSDEEATDRWFKCKLLLIILDEKSDVEKRVPTNVLVQTVDLRDVAKKLDKGVKGTMADYRTGTADGTLTTDAYPYENKEEESESGEDEA